MAFDDPQAVSAAASGVVQYSGGHCGATIICSVRRAPINRYSINENHRCKLHVIEGGSPIESDRLGPASRPALFGVSSERRNVGPPRHSLTHPGSAASA